MKNPITIMCYGDSNTYGYNPSNGLRYPSDVRWTGILQRALGNDCLIVEEGCNGRTAFAVPTDEPWKFGEYGLEACLNTHKPIDLFIIMLGANDLKSHFNASSDDIAGGVKSIITKTRDFLKIKQGFMPKVIVVSPTILGNGFTPGDEFDNESISKSEEFSSAFNIIAKETDSYFINAADYIKSSEIDSLHLDPDAHSTLAKVIGDFIASILTKNML